MSHSIVDRLRRTLKAPLHSPVAAALLITLAFYAIVLGALQPGYAINDDIKIIAIAAGYPDVQPSPFLIFSNVLWGFLLVPLYALGTPVNWEIVFFVILNMVSVGTLLYLVAVSRAARPFKALGVVLVLTCALYYTLNITFSSTAALACFVGLSAILAGASEFPTRARDLLVIGIGLLLTGSLIRIQMLVLSLPPVLVAAACLFRTLQLRTVAVGVGCAAALVFAGYAVDRLYVRANPEWNTFYFYNRVAMQMQDSHRLENVKLEIRRIGWSGNDQEVFARYFFPDAGTYSIERLRYLVDRVPGVEKNPSHTLGTFLRRLATPRPAIPLLALGAAMIFLLAAGATGPGKVAAPLIAGTALVENLAVMLIYKNPDYVFISSLANAGMLGALVLAWPRLGVPEQMPSRPRRGAAAALVCGLLVAAYAAGLALRTALLTSRDNQGKQVGYARIMQDMDEMRRNGQLAENPVVFSTSHGIPWDWSNPLLLGFPSFTYLDTGWNTFSPHYEEAIRRHNMEPVLEALYANESAYVISKTIFKDFLALYYREHYGITVAFETLYLLPNPNHYDGYDGVELYQVKRVP